jgi:pyroglutamyl-peptidase
MGKARRDAVKRDVCSIMQNSNLDCSRGKASSLRVLVTGFGRFPGARSNPSASLVAALGTYRARLARLGIDLQRAILPVHYAGVGPALRRLEQTLEPDAILHFGLAARRKCLSLETRALNRVSLLHCDASRACAPRRAVLPGAPQIARSTFPYRQIEAAFRRASLRCCLSADAGNYICNKTLYLSLTCSQVRSIGFIHMPLLASASRPRKASQNFRPNLAQLTRAALIAILVTARQLRQHLAEERGSALAP